MIFTYTTENHLSEYDEMRGVAMVQSAFETYSVSKFECAQKCSTKLKCQSFDHCADINTCLLHSQQLVDLSHPQDIPQHLDLNQNCSHYSSKLMCLSNLQNNSN